MVSGSIRVFLLFLSSFHFSYSFSQFSIFSMIFQRQFYIKIRIFPTLSTVLPHSIFGVSNISLTKRRPLYEPHQSPPR